MSDTGMRGLHQDYSKFDKLSSAELKEMLRLDLEHGGAAGSDAEPILYITNLLLEREGTGVGCQMDTSHEGWLRFKKQLDKSIFDEDEMLDTAEPSSDEMDGSDRGKVTRIRHRRVLRTVGIVAAIVAALMIMTVTCYANGFDVWDAVATWSRDTFGFTSAGSSLPAGPGADACVPPQLQEMAEQLSYYGYGANYLPSYIPEGYEVNQSQFHETPSAKIFYLFLEKEEMYLTIQ